MQIADGVARIVTQRILEGEDANNGLVTQHQNHRLPGVFQFANLPGKRCRRLFSRRANQNTFAVNLRFNPGASQRSLRFRRRDRQIACLRFADNSLCQRVRSALFYGCRQRQQFSFADTACRMNRRHPWFTNGQRTGFIKGDLRDTAQLLQRCAAFNQCAAPCRRRQPGGNGRGRGDHQRARATDEQQRQPFINPLLPAAIEHQRRNKRHQQRDDHNDWRIDAAETVNKPLNGRTALFRLFNQRQDTVNRAGARFR